MNVILCEQSNCADYGYEDDDANETQDQAGNGQSAGFLEDADEGKQGAEEPDDPAQDRDKIDEQRNQGNDKPGRSDAVLFVFFVLDDDRLRSCLRSRLLRLLHFGVVDGFFHGVCVFNGF